jgi:type IV pilus assembly protein PilO
VNFDIQEFLESLQGLDPENIGSWPVAVRALIFVVVFVAVFIGGNYFLVKGVREDLLKQQREETKLIQDYEKKSFQAANLEEFKKQMEDLDGSYEALLRQLPRETEVPGLLEDITSTGLGSGLKFDSIDLGKEEQVEFYSVLPIDLDVKGGYHGLSGFISGVAALPRIVTLHDFVIEEDDEEKARTVGTRLKMKIQAKTYRYHDEEGE